MTHALPARPQSRTSSHAGQAMLTRLRANDADAARTFVDHLPAAKRMTLDQVRRANFRLAVVQSAIARKSGFDV